MSDTPEQDLFAAAAITSFQLNGQFLAIAEELAAPAGITAAWWQVLGAVLREPLPVAGIARAMGITRQSVQRIADLLVDKGLAEFQPNPAHRRAKLVAVTDTGREAIKRINPHHALMAKRLADNLPPDQLAQTLHLMTQLSTALTTITTQPTPSTRLDE
ncbi:MarR family transcriptional regulator [Nocardia vinacea]|uniref:MarR family winged helix-turn-helix transcriptional regulator n=1 Tax=Nocardia vinacea TaxID=96468 RepID=UPI0033D970D7